MRQPPIVLTCECGQRAAVRFGERWTCPECDRTWDTSQIPRDDYDRLLHSIRRYRLYMLGPPLAVCAILVPLAVLVGFPFGLLLFFLLMAYGLLVIPTLRARATESVMRNRATWELSPE